MRWTIAGLVLPALLIAGCSSGGEPGAPSEPLDDGAILPSPSKELGASVRPTRVLSGRLGFDAIEGGCAYLEVSDGSRYEVLYPDGWHLDRASTALNGPGGEQFAAGDLVSVRGSVASDRSSICQLGPIFVATEVVPHP